MLLILEREAGVVTERGNIVVAAEIVKGKGQGQSHQSLETETRTNQKIKSL